jgi:hypothetical protein
MTHFGFQDALVALCGAGAVAWLIARTRRAKRSGAACPSCPAAENCPSANNAPPQPMLIPLSALSLPAGRDRSPRASDGR